jgi:hypothetical protein
MTENPTKAIPTRKNVSRPAPPPIPTETLPDPPQRVPPAVVAAATGLGADKPQRPTDLAGAYVWLLRPFAQRDVEIKPGAMTKDRSRCLAMPYADMRVYFARLDKICGCENWSHSITLTERGAVCHLTIFGVTKSGAGDYPRDSGDENAATSAEAQAFKRACAAFGLGRYLYNLPQIWADYDDQKKQIIDPAQIVARMYGSLKNGDE